MQEPNRRIQARDFSLRNGRIGQLCVESRIPRAVMSSGCSTIFLGAAVGALILWGRLWELHGNAFGRQSMGEIPLASVPICLTVAAVMDAAVCAGSVLARGELRVSPLTPRLCAVIFFMFATLSVMQLPRLCSWGLSSARAWQNEQRSGDLAMGIQNFSHSNSSQQPRAPARHNYAFMDIR